MTEKGDRQPARPWLRPWLVVGLAAWAQIGVILVARANREGLVDDISISPYHVVGYAALATLGVYVAWAFFRALRRGAWREAFPPHYGGLGLGFAFLIGWVILDPIWRDTLGIDPGISEAIAPPRLLIFAALALLAAGPLRDAIAARSRPGLEPAEMVGRWAGVVAAGLIGGAVTLTAFNPVEEPLNDFTVNPGADRTEIWTMAADGSRQTRLLAATGNGVDYSLPAWSPDGQRIAYTVWTNEGGKAQNASNRDQTSAIWTMAPDGSDRRVVFEGAPDQAWIPAWSPDGQWIAYTLSPVSPQTAAVAEPQANPVPGGLGPPTTADGASIWIIHPDGSGNRRLTAEGMDAVGAAWSSDGLEIAYIAAGAGGASDIHVATVTDAGLANDVAVAADPANDWGPAWEPNGERLLFISDRGGNDDVWRIDLSGSEAALTQLTTDGAGDWVPAFAPDGSRIAFVSDRGGDPDVWSMAPDGTDARNLTSHPQHYDGQWSVAWSPDGTQIAYATGSYGDPGGSGWVREDFAAAEAILYGLALSILALLLVALGAPLGSFTVALTITIGLAAVATGEYRFIAGAIVAGLAVDALVRSVRLRWRARVAAAASAGFGNLAIGLTIAVGGTLAWSITLLLGVTLASAVLGWGLADAVERLLQRPHIEGQAAPTG